MREAKQRHGPGILAKRRRKDAAAILEKLRGYIALSLDVSDVADDLSTGSVGQFPLEQSVPSDPCGSRYGQLSLRDFLDKQIVRRAAWVQEREKALRDHIIQIGSLLGTEENIRTQTSMRRMTWWIIALTVVMIAIATLTLMVGFFGFIVDVGDSSGNGG